MRNVAHTNWKVTVLFDGDLRIDNIDGGPYANKAMRESAAKLVEAAPDLLLALRKAVAAYMATAEGDTDPQWVLDAQAALAKADCA